MRSCRWHIWAYIESVMERLIEKGKRLPQKQKHFQAKTAFTTWSLFGQKSLIFRNDPHLSVSQTMPPRCQPRIIKHHTQTPEISSPQISLVKQKHDDFLYLWLIECHVWLVFSSYFARQNLTPWVQLHQEFDFEYNDSRQTANSCSKGNEKIQITESFWSAVE